MAWWKGTSLPQRHAGFSVSTIKGSGPAERGESRVSSSGKAEKFLRNAQSTHGQRLTRVVPVAATDRDTRFKFLDGPNGFTVRGSKLGPVLMGYRRAGMQHVTLEEIRQALHHLA